MTATVDASMLTELLDPARRADPYPLLARIRDAGPLRLEGLPVVVFGRFADCQALLRDPFGSSDRRHSTLSKRVVESALATGAASIEPAPSFLFLDPPDHTRLRRLVSKAFTPRVVQRLEARARDLVDGLLDAAAERGSLDVVADLAYPLPVAVICHLLGVPVEDEQVFQGWSSVLAESLDPVQAFTGAYSPNAEAHLRAAEAISAYFADLIAARRDAPGEDLLSALIAAEEAGDVLSEEELISTCVLLLVAGHETTVNLIGNAALAMVRDPRWFAELRSDPGLADAIVEETLRYDPPVQMLSRIAREETTVGGAVLARGEVGVLLVGAAHRDPEAFDGPDTFRPGREDMRHIAFGLGPHFCVGAPLARMEGRLALTRLAQRVVTPRGDADPPYKPNVTLRGLAALPLSHDTITARTTSW